MVFLITLSINLAAFLGLWLYQEVSKNASFVDVLWAFSIGVQAGIYYWWLGGQSPHGVLTLFLAVFWCLRLSLYLTRRLWRQAEDSRYRKLREKWGSASSRNFLWVHLMNAAVSWLMALSFYPLFAHQSEEGSWALWLGFALGMSAIFLEALADYQLKKFKLQKANQGRVLDTGLWRYSRHPNYFFEWLHWLSYGVMAWGLTLGSLSFVGAVVIYVFLTRITGIPFERDKAPEVRPKYAEYVAKTSAFFPWPPKETRPKERA